MVCLLESILPICVISHIASFLPHESLKNLTGVSSTFQPIAERVLYRTIVLHSGPSFLICLQTIVLRRGPALWVRSLTVFIHYTSRLRRRGSLSPAHHHLLSRAIQLSQNLVELCFSTLDPHFSISYLLQIPNADEHREHRVKPCNLSPARILTQWLLRKPDVAVLGSPIHFDLGVLYPTFLPNLRSLSVFNLEVAAPMLSGRRIELIKLGVPSRNFEGFVNFILPALSTGIVPLKGFDCEFDCSARNLSLLASTLHQHLRSLESIRIELVGGNIAVHDVFLVSSLFSPHRERHERAKCCRNPSCPHSVPPSTYSRTCVLSPLWVLLEIATGWVSIILGPRFLLNAS
jgi:hypothetical protein